MSLMRCSRCSLVVDTDDDVASLYVEDDKCICEACREDEEIWLSEELEA